MKEAANMSSQNTEEFHKIWNNGLCFDKSLILLANGSGWIAIRETDKVFHHHPQSLSSVATMDQWYDTENAGQSYRTM